MERNGTERWHRQSVALLELYWRVLIEYIAHRRSEAGVAAPQRGAIFQSSPLALPSFQLHQHLMEGAGEFFRGVQNAIRRGLPVGHWGCVMLEPCRHCRMRSLRGRVQCAGTDDSASAPTDRTSLHVAASGKEAAELLSLTPHA
jgi:hypothetical protein